MAEDFTRFEYQATQRKASVFQGFAAGKNSLKQIAVLAGHLSTYDNNNEHEYES